jgi:regulation of enolase protein 1 (concanavalin A-like superfamily)
MLPVFMFRYYSVHLLNLSLKGHSIADDRQHTTVMEDDKHLCRGCSESTSSVCCGVVNRRRCIGKQYVHQAAASLQQVQALEVRLGRSQKCLEVDSRDKERRIMRVRAPPGTITRGRHNRVNACCWPCESPGRHASKTLVVGC